MGEQPQPIPAATSWLDALGPSATELAFSSQALHFGQALSLDATSRIALVAEGAARLVAERDGEECHIVSLGPGDTIYLPSPEGPGFTGVTIRASSARTSFSILQESSVAHVRSTDAAARALAKVWETCETFIALRRVPGLEDVPDDALRALAAACRRVGATSSDQHDIDQARASGAWCVFVTGDASLEVSGDGCVDLGAGDVLPLGFGTQPLVLRVAMRSCFLVCAREQVAALSAAHPCLEAALGDDDAGAAMGAPAAVSGGERPKREVDLEGFGELDLPVVRRRRIRRMPFVRQIDEADCGTACLAMVCRFFGRRISSHLLRRCLYTSADGVNLRAICHAARQLGLAARAAKISSRNLDNLPMPALARVDANHWIILYDVSGDRVSVADPATGRHRIAREDLLSRWDGFVALFDYTEDFRRAPLGDGNVAWLWPFLRPWMGVFGQAVLLAAVVALLEIVVPIFSQVVFDTVLVHRDLGLLKALGVSIVGVLFFLSASMMLERYLLSFVAVRVDAGTLDFLTRRLLDLPVSYFAMRRTGDLRRRLEGVRLVRDFVVGSSVRVLTAVPQLLAAVVLLGVYSPLLLLLFAVLAPAYAVLMLVSSRWLAPLLARLEKGFAEYDSHQIDAIRGVETVKAMGAEPALRQRMLDSFHKLANLQFRADMSRMSYEAGVRAVSFLLSGSFLVAGAVLALDGRITIGAFVAVNAVVGMANLPIATLLRTWDDAQLARVLLDRIQDVLQAEPEQGKDRSGLLAVTSLRGDVRLVGVGFSYPGVDPKPVLDDLELHAKPGTTIAIVGRSGCGKTTLAKCLAGLYMPVRGRILIDGIDLAAINLPDLRRHIGFVLQETHLFDGTIAANIALDEDEPDMAKVVHAAQIACAAEFIEDLALKYKTRIGEQGIGLSMGQRQRIAIARAIYRSPRILILDEATSALDTQSERMLQDNLMVWGANRTCFVIAHRLSTVRQANLTIVLEKGRIVERGTHDELVARGGLYHHLCGQQLAV
jgi:ABC-type bacteriocin/lantibiotic exporter with double-glycine peptidase domain